MLVVEWNDPKHTRQCRIAKAKLGRSLDCGRKVSSRSALAGRRSGCGYFDWDIMTLLQQGFEVNFRLAQSTGLNDAEMVEWQEEDLRVTYDQYIDASLLDVPHIYLDQADQFPKSVKHS